MTISKVAKKRINLAIELLRELGMPKTQQNQRTGLCLLALLGLKPDTPVCDATNPLMGITPIMDFSYENYKVKYAPNSRETFRRFSIHNMMQAGLVVYNPDDDERPTNSPKAAYQVTPEFLSLIQQYGSTNWEKAVRDFKTSRTSLAEKYAKPRDLVRIPVKYADKDFLLSPGEHNELIQSIIENFASAFLHGAELLYVGDTQDKSAYFNDESANLSRCTLMNMTNPLMWCFSFLKRIGLFLLNPLPATALWTAKDLLNSLRCLIHAIMT